MRVKIKDKESKMQFEPEILRNHHHKHIVEYDGKYQRCNTNYLNDLNNSTRSKSSDCSVVISHKVHNSNFYNNNKNGKIKNNISSNKGNSQSSSDLNNSEDLPPNRVRSSSSGPIISSTDDEEKSSLDDSIGNFNLSKPQKKSQQPLIVYVGDGRSRVRRVVSTQTRHVTVVSYSTRHKETRSHTSHHVTTVR